MKLWLSTFDKFDLNENHRAVIALGYRSKEFSTQDIIDRLGIVDTDQVRELVGGLHARGILETTKSKNQISKFALKNHVSRRNVPKYRILQGDQGSAVSGVLPTGIDEEFREKSFDLYLTNIPPDSPMSDITDFLSAHGCDVLDVRMPPGAGTAGRGFAFVTVASKESPDSTIASLDGQVLRSRRSVCGKPVLVCGTADSWFLSGAGAAFALAIEPRTTVT